MNFLLDTSVFLWVLLDSPELSASARQAIRDRDNEIFLSVVSVWEILVKHRLGKLPLPAGVAPALFLQRERIRHGIEVLALDEEAVGTLTRLPDHHRDPFDRMLICQAISASMTLLTPDAQIQLYPVRTWW